MFEPGPAPPDDRAEPAAESDAAAETAAAASTVITTASQWTTPAEEDDSSDGAWNKVSRRRVVKFLSGPSATFNPRSIAAIPQKGKKRLSPDEARSLIFAVKKASKLTVMGESEDRVNSLLIQAAAIGRQSSSVSGQASPATVTATKAAATGRQAPTEHSQASPASVTPMDTGSSGSASVNDPLLPSKKRQIPAITGFFPETFNHLAFARKLTGKLNTPPILTRRGVDKRGPAGRLEVKVRVSIQTTSESDFHTTSRFLQSEGIEFFVFRTLSDRTVKVVFRNLMELTPTDEIQAELVSQGFEVVSVAAMRNYRKEPLPMFLVELRDCATTPEIYNLRTLLHMRVMVEAYRGPSGPRQCHNCCRFGHVTSGCNAHPRCVKCAGAHHTNACTKSDPTTLATCANCNEQHTASYRGCPVFKAATISHKARLLASKSLTERAQPALAPAAAPKFVPAPMPTLNVWDNRSADEEVNQVNSIPTPPAKPLPAAQVARAVKPAAAKPPPSKAQALPAQAPKPQREKATPKPISNPTPNTTFQRSAISESDSAPSTSSDSSISSLIKRGLELLQMKLRSTSTSDRHALEMATLQFVVEAVQMLV